MLTDGIGTEREESSQKYAKVFLELDPKIIKLQDDLGIKTAGFSELQEAGIQMQ